MGRLGVGVNLAVDGHEAEIRKDMLKLLPDMRGFARFLVRDRSVADDLVQDAVVRALGALDQFRPGTNLKAWLFTILRNVFSSKPAAASARWRC